MAFYEYMGFLACGFVETEFNKAPRMILQSSPNEPKYGRSIRATDPALGGTSG